MMDTTSQESLVKSLASTNTRNKNINGNKILIKALASLQYSQLYIFSIPMLDGNGVKAMPGSIPTPSSGSLQKTKKIQVAKWGTPKKTKKRNRPKVQYNENSDENEEEKNDDDEESKDDNEEGETPIKKTAKRIRFFF